LANASSTSSSNAAKFTEQGDITIEARRVARPDGDDLVFVVRDPGIGMDEAAQARLFQPFTQADSSITRRFGGTGLGLSITADLARLLGGAIEVESCAGRGSSFTLTIPARLAPTKTVLAA
jgi:signal transduction histidine kinase